eukprot:jgi/Ulvmu1/9316/UM050_0065.1
MAQTAAAGHVNLVSDEPIIVDNASVTDAQVHRNLLAEMEEQCASHNRHPAEWDGMTQGWISVHEPAKPYAVINISLDPPKRSREVICELLAAGVPVATTAHQEINNATHQKQMAKKARKIVVELRSLYGLLPHINVAITLGILNTQHRDFYMAVQDRIETEGPETDAYAVVSQAKRSAVGTVTLDMLNAWLAAMCEDDYNASVKAELEVLRLMRLQSKSPGDSVATVAAATDSDRGAVAVKTAQFLEGLYFQEVKRAKQRRSKGLPPVALQTQATAGLTATVAPGAAADAETAAAASSLPWLPPGCTWGYRTPDGFFVPYDPTTRATGDPTRAAQKPANAVWPEGEDEELSQLAHAYRPVLWAPDKAELAQRCWNMYAATRPGAVKNDRTAKEAAAEHNVVARHELRVAHFGKLAERQLLRDVALVAQERIRSGLFEPTGCEVKALESLKVKTLVLQLPEREPSLPPPLQRLLAIDYEAPLGASKPGAKKRKVRAG